MIAQFSDPTLPPIAANGLFGLLAQQAQLHPDKEYCYAAGKSISYDEMCQQTARLAAQLKTLAHQQQSTTVAVSVNERPALLMLIWAALKAGLCLAFMPEGVDEAKLRHLMVQIDAKLLITDSVKLQFLPCAVSPTALQDKQTDYGLGTIEDAHISPGTLAFIFQTSGTTGKPKSIQVTHEQFATAINSMLSCGYLDHAVGQVAFITPPLFHSYGLSTLLEYTAVGATIVLPPESSALGAVGDLMEKTLADKITAIEAVPHFYAQLVRLLRRVELTALRHLGIGGGKLDLNVIEQIKERFPRLSYSVRYGLTETPSIVSQKRFTFPYSDKWHSSGAVLPIYDLRIVDEWGHGVPQGQQGEIHLKGPALALPYLGESASTDYFSTGDIGYIDSAGELCIVGRNSLFIKMRGYRISPETVESAICSNDSVIDCRVRGADDVISAEIIPAPNFIKQQLLRTLNTKLPSYAIPSTITIVETIPRTPSGKIIRY